MKIAIIGATGLVGAKILSEGLDRGHEVTAIVRNPERLPTHPKLTAARGDATEPAELASLVAGHDVVISAFNPGLDESGMGAKSIIDAVKRSKVERLLVVGGAGSLEIAPGKRLVDQPNFPARWKYGALRTADFLDQLRGETELDWAFVSPAAMRTCSGNGIRARAPGVSTQPSGRRFCVPRNAERPSSSCSP